METEIYRKKIAIVEPPEPDNESLTLYKSLGFKGLETLASTPDPADWYPELTPSEIRVWKAFLPTVYLNKSCLYDQDWRGWDTYCFDTVPLPILKELETAQNLGFFTLIAIRTPERQTKSDPAAIGYYEMPNGNIRQFLICRWGESLIPYRQVLLRARRRFVFFLGIVIGVPALAAINYLW